MSAPPGEIDGARVIEWAWSGDKPFGVIRFSSGAIAAEIFGLAICSYSDGLFYRFSCDRNWNAEHDSVYSTVEEARERLPIQYQEVKPDWRKLGPI